MRDRKINWERWVLILSSIALVGFFQFAHGWVDVLKIQKLSNTGTLVASIATALGIVFIYRQLKIQTNRNRTELTLGLNKDFFGNKIFSEIFAILDSDNQGASNNTISQVIDNHPESTTKNSNPLKETDLSYYLNFFNSLGYLLHSNSISKADLNGLFNYQINYTFRNEKIIHYAIEGKFNYLQNLSIINKISFFFYGNLMSSMDRCLLQRILTPHSSDPDPLFRAS